MKSKYAKKEEVNLMGHIKLLEFYGLRLMVLLTFRDFEGHIKTHRSPKEAEYFWPIIPKEELKAQENFHRFHNIVKDNVNMRNVNPK